jgi:hypothetical protein
VSTVACKRHAVPLLLALPGGVYAAHVAGASKIKGEQDMNTSEVTLGSFADPEQTSFENFVTFLQEVRRASLPDIVGATSAAWAVCHGAVHRLMEEGKVTVDEAMSPWEYVWKEQ